MNVIKECILSCGIMVIGFLVMSQCTSSDDYTPITPDNNRMIYIEDFISDNVKRQNIVDTLKYCVNKYIKSVASDSELDSDILVDCCLESNVDIILALAQGQIESKFGTIGRAAKTHSVWNVGAWDGVDHTKSIQYKSANESIPGYVKLISTHYSDCDPYKNFIDDKGRRYASDPDYEQKLKKQANHIKRTTDIDCFWNKLI